MGKQIKMAPIECCPDCPFRVAPLKCAFDSSIETSQVKIPADCPLPDYVDMEGKVAVDAELWEKIIRELVFIDDVTRDNDYLTGIQTGNLHYHTQAILKELEGDNHA